MSFRAITIGAAVLLWAVPAAAQQRGTVEFGAFGSAGSFDNALTLGTGFGGGGRMGVFLDPRFAIEFEKGEMSATSTVKASRVNVGLISGRAVWTPIRAGALSIVLGAGAAAGTETNFLHSYGVNALLGAKVALNDNIAIRVDGVGDWLANNQWAPFQSIHLGLSFFRSPNNTIRNVLVAGRPGRTVVDTIDRTRDGGSYTRVDTVRVLEPMPDQLILRVQFQTDSTVLLPISYPVLDTIAMAIVATPGSRWEVQGHTDSIGTAAANRTLGQGRAQTVVDYLVSKGVPRRSLTAVGFGPDRPVFSNSTEYGRAQNRRVQLRRIPPPPKGTPVP